MLLDDPYQAVSRSFRFARLWRCRETDAKASAGSSLEHVDVRRKVMRSNPSRCYPRYKLHQRFSELLRRSVRLDLLESRFRRFE